MVQPCHHFAPLGWAAPTYAVPATVVPAAVASLPVNVASPPVASGELAAGVQSKADACVVALTVAGNAVKSAVVAVVLLTSAFPAISSEFWMFVPFGPWKI